MLEEILQEFFEPTSLMTAATFLLLPCCSYAAATTDWMLVANDFSRWMMDNDVRYVNPTERNARYELWNGRQKKVISHNAGNSSWEASVNSFSDRSAAGLKSRNGYIGSIGDKKKERVDSIDWRMHGIVNKIKNQEQCGSCWAFSAIASLEGQYALHHNLTSFSEQDLVDCVKNVDSRVGPCCDGCEGGLMSAAFAYLMGNQKGGDDLETNYPYLALDGSCSWSGDGPSLSKIIRQINLPLGSQSALEEAVSTVGPISVGVDANDDWQMYSDGVYIPDPDNGGCSSDPADLDHGVAVVGYNTDTFDVGHANKTLSYWIIRNSWGTDWGIDGYMYLSKDAHNACGVANYATYPVVATSDGLSDGLSEENQCLNSHSQCPQEVCYTSCPCACFLASNSSPCDCSAATCTC